MHEATRLMVMASFPPGISDGQRKQLHFARFYGGDHKNRIAPEAWNLPASLI